MKTDAFFIVQQGSPHDEGSILLLQSEKVIVGRSWGEHTPDISFDDPHISRNHAEIIYDNEHFTITDLPNSKHGVEINGETLEKGVPHKLKHNDEVNMAKGTVVLRFCYQTEEGATLDLGEFFDADKLVVKTEDTQQFIIVDENRREVLVEGKEIQPRITGNEFELILLLYKNQGKAVPHEEIINWVWRDVANRDTILRQDVNTLAHRLRKSLGKYGKHIENIPSYGYRLDQGDS